MVEDVKNEEENVEAGKEAPVEAAFTPAVEEVKSEESPAAEEAVTSEEKGEVSEPAVSLIV